MFSSSEISQNLLDTFLMLSKTYFINCFKNYLRYLLCVVLVFYLTIMLFDTIELLRLTSKYQITLWQIFKLALMKSYSSYSKCLPITTLITALLFYCYQFHSNEIIAAQSLGINLFHILMPSITATLLFGIINILIINPVGTTLLKMYQDYSVVNEFKQKSAVESIAKSGIWVKNKLNGQNIIINALKISEAKKTLYGANIFILNNDGTFERSIIANQIEFQKHNVVIKGYNGIDKESNVISGKKIDLPIHISISQIYENLSTIDTISFYQFFEFIRVTKESGLATDRHILDFIQCILSPFFLVSMIFISFYFCNKFKGNHITYIGCLTTGLLVLFGSNFLYMMGALGKISILISAFFPVLSCNALGVFLLLQKN